VYAIYYFCCQIIKITSKGFCCTIFVNIRVIPLPERLIYDSVSGEFINAYLKLLDFPHVYFSRKVFGGTNLFDDVDLYIIYIYICIVR